MKLFEEYPTLESDLLSIHKMTLDDADALGELSHNPKVYRYLPTFLYEQKYDDPREVLEKMDAQCFDTKKAMMMGIYLKDDPGHLAGIAEVYALDERKPKVSIGCRLNEPYWGKGYGTETVRLLKNWLFFEMNVRTVTAHILQENISSARTVQKNGFICLYPGCMEDWGFAEPCKADKYVFKKRWFSGPADQPAEH